MNLTDILNRQANITVEYDGETISCVIRPELTARTQTLFSSVAVKQDLSKLAEALSLTIVSWDMYLQPPNEEKQDFPPTIENLSMLPISFLSAVAEAVADKIQTDADRTREAAKATTGTARASQKHKQQLASEVKKELKKG